MDRVAFVTGLIQRDRNVLQKTERVERARMQRDQAQLFSAVLEHAERVYTLRQNDLEGVLIERAEYIADYAEEIRPISGTAVNIRVTITNLDELRAIIADRCGRADTALAIGGAGI
jgi:hypothetical protein